MHVLYMHLILIFYIIEHILHYFPLQHRIESIWFCSRQPSKKEEFAMAQRVIKFEAASDELSRLYRGFLTETHWNSSGRFHFQVILNHVRFF